MDFVIFKEVSPSVVSCSERLYDHSTAGQCQNLRQLSKCAVCICSCWGSSITGYVKGIKGTQNHRTLLLKMQAMELPVGVWDKVGQALEVKEWAKSCGMSQAAYAARRSLVAAEVHSGFWDGEQICMSQLQLKKWLACHSLYLNLWRLHETGELTADQTAEIEHAARNAATLHCLHFIGRSQVPLMDSSLEGVLMCLLAKHASVLTLQVRTLTMPLDFPNLQHLMLDLGRVLSQMGQRARRLGTLTVHQQAARSQDSVHTGS